MDEGVKACSWCKEVKPLSEFGAHRRRSDGKNGWCKPCARAKGKEWREANPEKAKEMQRRWKLANRDYVNRYHADYMERTRYSIRSHGLEPERYDEMLAEQGEACALCHQPQGDARLFIDHDHACCPGTFSCGRCVRGLLCRSCNTGLGTFRDDPGALMRAAAYILAHRDNVPL